jgi:hypothetical protein
METDEPALSEEWTRQWSDLVACEIVTVLTSNDAAARGQRDVSSTSEVARASPRSPVHALSLSVVEPFEPPQAIEFSDTKAWAGETKWPAIFQEPSFFAKAK